jgi:hypothetical protein
MFGRFISWGWLYFGQRRLMQRTRAHDVSPDSVAIQPPHALQRTSHGWGFGWCSARAATIIAPPR